MFCNGNPEENDALAKRCLENKGPQYYEAALLLRVLTELEKVEKSKGGLAKVEKVLEISTWRIKIQQFIDTQSAG